MMKGLPSLLLVSTLVFRADESGATLRYVWAGSPSPVPGYTAWTNAAHTVQEALNAAADGDVIIVTNGVYDAGGAARPDRALTNRVCLAKAVTLRSVNGPAATWIVGAAGAGGGNGAGAVRGAYVGANALLCGFTITNGHTLTAGDGAHEMSGGGAWLEASGVVSNCVLAGNAAASRGGGAAYGTLWNSLITGNSADSAAGVYGPATLFNCRLSGNAAAWEGGGARKATLHNCTVAANAADTGGGVYEGAAENSIIYDNNAVTSDPNWKGATLAFCCADPHPGGDNVAGPPQFADAGGGDYRLASDSPCIDAGTNRAWMAEGSDLAGAPRLLNGRVDIGAHEYYGAPFVNITNADFQVFGETASVSLGGTNNAYVTGTMT